MGKKSQREEKPMREETIYLPDYNARISDLAYYRAQNRGFEPGHEMEDWFEAELEFLTNS